MTDKMGKKELLEELDMGIYWVEGGMCEQAHDQLKAIIKQHFREAMPENPYPIGHDEFGEVKVHGEQSEAQSSVDEVDVKTIAKDLVIMIGEQGQTEEGVAKYLEPILQSKRTVTSEDYKAEYFKLRARCKEEGIEVE